MIGVNNPQSQVIKGFVEKRVAQIEKTDLDIFTEYAQRDNYGKALSNATKLWLLSGEYDRVRKPGWAGFFSKLLREYSMDEAGAANVVKDLKTAITGKISEVSILDVEAIPDVAARSWKIGVTALDEGTQISTNATRDGFTTISADPNVVSPEQ